MLRNWKEWLVGLISNQPNDLSSKLTTQPNSFFNRFQQWIRIKSAFIWQLSISLVKFCLSRIDNWLIRFRKSDQREKWLMVRLPLLGLGIFILLLKIWPYFVPPKIITTYPGNHSQEAPLNSRIEVIFDRGMLKKTVENNFHIKPEVAGDISWEGDQKFVFTPKTNLTRGQEYQVIYPGVTLSKFLIPVFSDTRLTFETIGEPKVILAAPQDEALEDLAPVTVIFDRPMIPLTTATNSALKQAAFNIKPQVLGDGRWLGTTAYQFRPSNPYRRGTSYQVVVPAGLKSQDEGVLLDDYRWEFSSDRPKIEKVSPRDKYEYASNVASVSAIFNQNIDPTSIRNHFVLVDNNQQPVAGRFDVSGQVFGFYANVPLKRESWYIATIKAGATNTEGPNGLETDYSWTFKVAARPEVLRSVPLNGASHVDNEHQLKVFFTTPMDEESFKGNFTIDPKPELDPTYYFSSYNNQHELSIGTYLARSTTYSVSIGANVTDQYGVALGSPYTFAFTTSPYQPSINISPQGTYFGAFNQQITPRVIVQVVNATKVDYALYRLSRDDLLDLYRRRYDYQRCPTETCRNWQDYNPDALEKVNSWSETFAADYNIPTEVVTKVITRDGSNIPAGFYFLDTRIGEGKHDNLVMIVSKSTITVKKSDSQLFVWAVDQSSAEVVRDMKLQLTDSYGRVLTEGLTNQDGVLMQVTDLFQKEQLFVFGEKADDIVVAASAWSNGINRYDFGLPSYYSSNASKDYRTKQDYKLFITLDRPIYRPDQKVFFKGVIRKDNDAAYENLPLGEKVVVGIKDARDRSVYNQELPLSTFGSFAGDLILSKDANLGYYQINATYSGNSFNQSFQVEEYRKPELAVTITPNKLAYVQNDQAQLTINAAYYFGAAVTNSPVEWILQTQDYNFRWDKDWRYEFGDPDASWFLPWWDYGSPDNSFGKKVTEGKGRTDIKGNLDLTLPLDLSKYKTSQKLTIEATINDINNQAVAVSSDITVHKGSVYVGLHPQSYANTANITAAVEIVTVDINGKELPNQQVTLEFYKRTWQTVREKDPEDGRFYYVSKPSDALVENTTITTDNLGRGTGTFTPLEGGTFKVFGKVIDKDGNQNLSGTFLWVSGAGFSTSRENHDRITLVTDKRDYLVGESMSIFVASPFASSTAKTLLTIERASVLEYQVVDTSDITNNFPITITPKFSPNVFVGAVLVKPGNQVKNPPEFKIGYTEAKVTDKKQQVKVDIIVDKKKYKPKDTLKVTLHTSDVLGHPVPAELALGLVDKAVWDLAVAQLPDIYKTFYQPRNLEVETAQLLTISFDRINANTNLGAKGGSGGGGGDGGSDTSRRDFPETAYWNPQLKTNANGVANVEIKLPDNLTTWRLAAIANSEQAAFGSGVAEVLVSRDLLIRPFLPRFLANGDEARLGAIVVNTSGQPQTINTQITASGLAIKDEPVKKSQIPDGGQVKIMWDTAAQNVTSAKINLQVENSDKTLIDKVEMILPVKSYSVPEVVATSGQAKDTALEKIVLPKEIDLTQGLANITLAPTLGSSAFTALPYLYDYPYYCVEQITSRLLPAVFVHRILTNARIERSGPANITKLKEVVEDGIQRLNNSQHADGGWGWWTEYNSHPFLTAYAYLGLSEAKKDGFTVADSTLTQSQQYLENALSANSVSPDLQAYILYVLKDKNQKLTSYASNLFDKRFELTLETRAYLAMAMKNLPGMTSKSKRLLNEIASLAKKTATTTHWEESKPNYMFMGSNTSTTAMILEALVSFDSQNPLIPEVVRHLMTIRRDNHWQSTRDTATVIKAIATQLLVKGDSLVDENYRLELNGKILKEGKFTKTDLLQLEEYAIDMSKFRPGEQNTLQVTKSGRGNLYYNLNFKYYLPFSEIVPLEQGMVVVREFVDGRGMILPLDKINENTEVWVRLIIVTPEERNFVVVEDILPAGLEAVNESLKNVSILNSDKPKPKQDTDRLWYFAHNEYHDDRTTMFADYLPPGVYEVLYRVRATTPGKYHHPPAQAYQMYVPDVSGHSSGGWLEIK